MAPTRLMTWRHRWELGLMRPLLGDMVPSQRPRESPEVADSPPEAQNWRTEGWYWNPEAVPEGKPWAPGPFTFQFSTDLWAQEESPPPPHCVGGGIPGHRGWVECPDVSLMPLGAAPSQRVACLGHDPSRHQPSWLRTRHSRTACCCVADANPFLQSVHRCMTSRLLQLPDKHSVTALLNTWAQSIHQACLSAA